MATRIDPSPLSRAVSRHCDSERSLSATSSPTLAVIRLVREISEPVGPSVTKTAGSLASALPLGGNTDEG